MVQRDLSWSVHISKICAKAYKTLHLICRTVSSTSPQTRLNLYFSLIWCKLMFCSQLWRPHLIKDITCLEQVQCRATKFVLNDFTSNYKSRQPHSTFSLYVLAWNARLNVNVLNTPLTILTYSLIYPLSPHVQGPQAPRSSSTISVGPHQPSTFISTELFISGMPFHQLTSPNPTLPSKDR